MTSKHKSEDYKLSAVEQKNILRNLQIEEKH